MNKIYIGNLPFQTTAQDLESNFQQFGKIKEVALIKDKYTNECKGFAFITFDTVESARNALALNGHEFQGRAMKVNIAEDRRTDSRPRKSSQGYSRGHSGYGGGRSSGRGRR